MVNAQEWLDKNYPIEERKLIIILEIRNKDLEGSLDLGSFINLEQLDCRDNKITELKVNYQKITEIRFNDNQIRDFEFSSLNPEIFNLLWMDNNKLSPRDLSCFSHLTNLCQLGLEGNPFYGPLKYLEDLSNLVSLNVTNTNI